MQEVSEHEYEEFLTKKFMRLSEILEDPFFLQVGAADGVIAENLRGAFDQTDWSSVMLEPLPDMFAKLQTNWAHKPKYTLINAAMAPYDGFADIRRIPPELVRDDAAWEWGVSSIDGVRSAFTEGPVDAATAKFLTERSRLDRVKTITFDTLRQQVKIPKIDYLQIDTEGYDLIVMQQIDLIRYRPFLIQCEIFNLSAVDRSKLFSLLQRFGYKFIYWKFDLVAWLL